MKSLGSIRGHIGGVVNGWDLDIAFRADGRLEGDFGGLLSRTADLTFDGTTLAGELGMWTVEATLADGQLTGVIQGTLLGVDMALTQDGDAVSGRVGGLFGFDVDLLYDGDTGQLQGRFGGLFEGNDLSATVQGVPPLVAAAIGAALFYERRQSRQV